MNRLPPASPDKPEDHALLKKVRETMLAVSACVESHEDDYAELRWIEDCFWLRHSLEIMEQLLRSVLTNPEPAPPVPGFVPRTAEQSSLLHAFVATHMDRMTESFQDLAEVVDGLRADLKGDRPA